MKHIVLILSILLLEISCTDNKYSKIENERILQGIFLSDPNGSTVTCTSSPTFSTLALSSTNCGGCHNTGGPNSGTVNVSNYASVTAMVSPGNPESSLFYTSIKSGKMVSFSNADLNKAVYCWIKAGASQ